MFQHKPAEKLTGWLDGYGLEAITVSSLAGLILLGTELAANPQAVSAFLVVLAFFSPVWLPFFLFGVFWVTWMHYIRYLFLFDQEYVLLEIQLPQEVDKSPLAMETILVSLWNNGGETTFIARIWKGAYRAIFSLEIASNEGRIGFYIRARKSWKNVIEARIYGQFPDAKVVEVEDYVTKIDFASGEYDLFGTEYAKSDPHALSIKTYVDFGLDKDPKEEYKVDPIANIIELLGQVGKDEYYWFQIIMKARKKDEWYGFYLKHDHYTSGGAKEIENIMAGAAKRAKKVIAENEITEGKTSLLTDGEKRRIDSIERSMSKLIFECGFRTLYLAKKDKFNGANIPHMIRFFDPFKGMAYENNSFNVTRGMVIFDYPWQDFRYIRRDRIKEQMFFFYRHRAYFYVPYDQEPVFMNVEELATIWHFPSAGIKTPGLNRVAAKRAEAPMNLPTLPS